MRVKERRLGREHGRILSVETKVRGDALDEDALAGATTLVVGDAGDFDEDGGWLTINGQVVEYTAVDDDEGIITLATGLTAAADEGDAVHLWDPLYEEVVDYQEAQVELDGEHDNPEPVVAEVAEGVGDLPEGDRGGPGESCTLHLVSDDDESDECEIVGVGGRPRKSQGMRAEADDNYVLTADDVAAGVFTWPLSHRPIDESVLAYWLSVAQRPTEYTVNYDDQTITWPLSGFEKAGDRFWVHYWYRKDIKTAVVSSTVTVDVPYSGEPGDGSLSTQYGVSVVGAGQVLADGSDSTYVNYSGGGGGFFSSHDPATAAIPSAGYTAEWWWKTDLAGGEAFNVYVDQPGAGVYARWQYNAEPDATAEGGWLHAPLLVVDPAGLASGLNGGNLRLQGELLGAGGRKVFEAKLVVTWDTSA